jgi:hypothetical protein
MDFTINIVPTVELFQESRALIAATRVDEPDVVLRYLLLTRINELNEVEAVIEYLVNIAVVTASQAGALVGVLSGLKDCDSSDVIQALAGSERLIEPDN